MRCHRRRCSTRRSLGGHRQGGSFPRIRACSASSRCLLGLVQRMRVDVGGVDDGALKQPFLTQQDGHGIHLFPRAAARDPDLDRGPGTQQRHHFVAHGKEVVRVTEHLADRDRQVLQQLHEHARVVQHTLLQRRHRQAIELTQRVEDPTLDRSAGIIAEIVAVLEVDRLDQQSDLDVGVAFASQIRSSCGSQTRINENRRSRSIGLAR